MAHHYGGCRHGGRHHGGRHGRLSNNNSSSNNKNVNGGSNPHKRKFHNQDFDGSQAGGVHEEESVDDLMVASMAVAATWTDSTTFASRPGRDGSSSEEESDDTEDEESDSGDSSGDDSEGESLAEDANEEHGKNNKDGKDIGEKNSCLSEKKTEEGTNSAVDENDQVDDSNIKEEEDDDDDEEEEAGDDDDISDIDLAENLAQMVDDEDDVLKGKKNSSNKNGAAQFGAYEPPRTEHEIDPYRCPTDQLEKLNVSINIADGKDIIPQSVQSSPEMFNDKGCGILVEEEMKSRLLPAGTIRSFISEQRTIVVDSFIPSSSRDGNFYQDSTSQTLDEGNMLVMLTKNREIDGNVTDGGGALVATSLNRDGEAIPRLQILGKIMEVFGPVQRPLYVIRLPDPPRSGDKKKTIQGDKPVKDEVAEKESANHQLDATSNDEDKEIVVAEEAVVKDECALENMAVKSEDVINEKSRELGNPSNTEDDEASLEDLWSANGKMTVLVRSHPNAIVYCLKDQTKLVDTDHIIRISGKGCDASNMYDEELDPSEQQYFSDDEEERQAKRANKNNRKQTDINTREGGRTSDKSEHGDKARGSGRSSERGREKSRGGQRNGSGSFMPQYNHHYGQNSQYSNSYPNPQFNHTNPPPPPPTYSYPPGQRAYQQNNYQQQQFQQLNHNFTQQTQFAYPVYQMQHNSPAFRVPPPPPPPPPPSQSGPAYHVMNISQQATVTPHVPEQHSTYAQPHHQQLQQHHQGNAMYSQHQTQSSESDTVYYNYSGA